MKLGIRLKLFLVSAVIALVAPCFVLAYAYLTFRLESQLMDALWDGKVAHPEVVARVVGLIQRLVVLAAVIALVFAGVMSSFAAQSMSRIVRELTDITQRMIRGDLGVRAHFAGDDELGDLGRALDQLAGSLASSLGQLRAERDLQASILDGMKEGVLVLEREDRIILMNPALREMLLLRGASDVGKLLHRVGAARRAPTRSPGAGEVAHDHGHGGARSAWHQAAAPPHPCDRPRRRRRRCLGGVRRRDRSAPARVSASRLRRQRFARAAPTPVNCRRSRVRCGGDRSGHDSALKDPDPKAAERFADIIIRNSERLQNLIEDLLELSRLESNEFKLKKERVDLTVVASLVMSLFRERAERKSIQLLTDIPSGLGVETDQRALEQVLSNLVDNAVKYCPAGAMVKLRAANGDGMTRLIVEDTGPGISEAHLPRLFERFYRVDAGRSRDVGGTGLGLSIVKHMVEAMGGEVTVKSTVGKGSAFEVRLPLAPKAARAIA